MPPRVGESRRRCAQRWHRHPGPSTRPVLCARAWVNADEVAGYAAAALKDLRGYITRHGIEVDGPPFVICHPGNGHTVSVEAGWPVVSDQQSGTDRVHCSLMPPNLIRPADRAERAGAARPPARRDDPSADLL